MRLPRITTRRWVVLIVIVAVSLLGAMEVLGIREGRTRYQGLADDHARQAVLELSYSRVDPTSKKVQHVSDGRETGTILFRNDDKASWPHIRELRLREARWHFLLEQKYREAALAPWLPVSPDPPRPK
jgi:hypothetical protein